jgi:hypothetical protein
MIRCAKFRVSILQVTFGGRGSNYTQKRVIEESPLIQVYRSCHSNMERNLSLPGPTTTHAEPNLRKTIKKLVDYAREHRTNEFVAGRTTTYSIPDMMDKGQDLVFGNVQEDEVEAAERIVINGEDLAVV